MKPKLSTLVVAGVVAAYSLSMLPIRQVALAQDDRRSIRVQQGAKTERRVALVIGNSTYKDSPLLNSVNDARDMAVALRGFGFEVIFGENLSQTDMKRNIRAFGEKIRNNGVGLFYYAGHGVQIRGSNYLIPVGATIISEDEVEYESVDVGLLLAQMGTARNRLNIVILDACRNNPFARSFRSTQKGLASIDAPGGTLLAYATAPGSVASDGTGRNGLYTQELLKYMRMPDLSIEQVFKQVRVAVRSQTQGKQIPWESSSLEGDFYFSILATASNTAKDKSPATLDPATIELSFWESIKSSSDVDDYKEYLAKYPSGTFAGIARNKIRTLEAAAKAPATDTITPPEPKSNAVTNPKSVENLPSVTGSHLAKTNSLSLETLSDMVARGEEVVLKVKYDYAVSPYHYLHDGLVSVSKTAVAFDAAEDLSFAVNPDKILEMTNQASRVHMRVAIKNKKGDKEDRKEVDFYNTRAATVGSGPGGTGLSVECNACDDAMTVLYELLRRVRSSSTTRSVDLAASAPGKYFRKGQSSSDYLELKADGTFNLQEGTKSYRGAYTVQGTIITFRADGRYQYHLMARLGHHSEFLVRGETTLLRKISYGKADPWSDNWEKQP